MLKILKKDGMRILLGALKVGKIFQIVEDFEKEWNRSLTGRKKFLLK